MGILFLLPDGSTNLFLCHWLNISTAPTSTFPRNTSLARPTAVRLE